MARSELRLEEEPMPWYDLPEEQLKDYRTSTPEPAELDRWWRERLDQARAAAREPALTPYEPGVYAPLEVYDAEFSGAGGDRIRAWYLRPAGGSAAPVVVEFIGYGGGRGLPAVHGVRRVLRDHRGQGHLGAPVHRARGARRPRRTTAASPPGFPALSLAAFVI